MDLKAPKVKPLSSDYSLCEKCNLLFSHAALDLPRHIADPNKFLQLPVKYTKASIQQTAEYGCSLCDMFLECAKTQSAKDWTSLDSNDSLQIFAYGWALSPQFGPRRDGSYYSRDLPKDTVTEISLKSLNGALCVLWVAARAGQVPYLLPKQSNPTDL